MNEYVILTDSSCDLPYQLADQLEVKSLPLSVLIGGEEFFNHLSFEGIDMSDFFSKLRKKVPASTSAVNREAAMQFMRGYLEEGKDILTLAFSSGLSNTYAAFESAAMELRQEYPKRRIFVVDTLCASLGQGLLVYLVCQKRAEGYSLDQLRLYSEELKLKIFHAFTVDDLMFLRRGGRVSTTTALVGSALNIKPMMRVDDEGKLEKIGTVKGRKASIQNLFESMKKYAVKPSTQVMFICHGDCMDDALALKELVAPYAKDVIINYVGPVIGAHSGPGTLALFFVAEHR